MNGSESTKLPCRSLQRIKRVRAQCKRRRLRLQLESLEPRMMLAADSDPAWAVYQTPIDLVETNESTRAVAQFTHESISQLSSTEAVQDFFDEHPGVDVLYGLGTPGQFAVAIEHDGIGACFAGATSVQWVEQDTTVSGFATPDDPSFDLQHGLSNSAQNGGAAGADIDATLAWDITTGSLANVAAVIDTGIDYTHPDLFLNVWLNQGEIPATLRSSLIDSDTDGLITFRDLNQPVNSAFVSDANGNSYIDAGDLLADPSWENGVDDDGNSFVDDLIGWDFRNNDNDPLDDHGHGTHVSGILGATGDNGLGVTGVNWDVQMMPLKFLGQSNSGSTIDASRAIRYATMMRTDFGVNVKASNNSWGARENPGEVLRDAISDQGDSDILFVAGAGNGTLFRSGINLDDDAGGFFPASFSLDNIISVASSNTDDKLAIDSNFGVSSVDVSAPGVFVLSTRLDGGYETRNGTSMAAPHVAGAALLVWANLPDATLSEVRDAILGSTDAVPSSSGKLVTGGRVSANGALQIDTFAPRASLTPIPTLASDGGTSQAITISVRDNVLVDVATIDDADLRVVRRDAPDNPLAINLDFASSLFPAQSLSARYIAAAPGGSWDRDDNGVYDIVLVAGQVSDNIGISNFQIPLGSFEVRIAFAGDIPITTFADGADSDIGDGISRDASGNSTLRSAIQTANASPGENTLILEPGTYTLGLAGANEDAAVSGDLDITDTLTIIGNGSIIDAALLDRVFDVKAGATLNLRGVTLTGGNVTGDGGGIRNLGGNITITNATIHDNQATASGGAIHSESGTVTLLNATVSTNTASVGAGLNLEASTIGELLNTTVTNNTANSTAGGVQGSGAVTLRNTIVAGNFATTNPDTAGGFVSAGHNLIGVVGSATGLTNGSNGNLVGTLSSPIDAKIGPLKDNTGSLLTHVPASESPAVDAGDNTDTPPTDARGIDRILDANRDREPIIDIGAVEKFFGSIEGVAFIDRDGDGDRHIAVDIPFTGIEEMTAVGDTLYFTFDDGEHGRELWKINDFGARLVRDIAAGSPDSTPTSLVDVNGTLFFAADNGDQGRELWKSDGTRNGTVLVSDIFGGDFSSTPNHFAAADNEVYFAANDGINGVELWKSDGTEEGTVLVRSIAPGPASSFPENLTNVAGTLVFTADDGTTGREIWSSGGTSASTSLIADINSAGSSNPTEITAVGGVVAFSADDGSGHELYRSESPFDTVAIVSQINPNGPANPSELTDVDGTLLFAADGPSGRELYKSLFPYETASLVTDINTGPGSSAPTQLTVVGDRVFFSAETSTNGRELWVTEDDFGVATIFGDIEPGANGSFPFGLVSLNDELLFVASVDGRRVICQTNGNEQIEIATVDSDVQSGVDVMKAGGTVYLAFDSVSQDGTIWTSKGTLSSTQEFTDIGESLRPDTLVFVDDNRNGQLDPLERSTRTSVDGLYVFEQVDSGYHEVRIPSSGDEITRPLNQNELTLDLNKILENPYSEFGAAFIGDFDFLEGPTEPSSVGDFNGDGFEDITIYDYPDTLYVLYGSENGIPGDINFDQILSGESDEGFALQYEVASPVFNLIATLHSIGDFNNDGFDDVASTEHIIYGQPNKISGLFDQSTLDASNGADGSLGIVIEGITNYGRSLGTVRGVGDINGDGHADIAIADTGASVLGLEGAGKVFVVFGPHASPTLDLASIENSDGTLGFVIEGDVRQQRLGKLLSAVGDLDKDGYDELYIGDDLVRSSQAFLLYGQLDLPVNMSASHLRGSAAENGFGFSIPGAGVIEHEFGGDINGDGIVDVVFGNGNTAGVFGSEERLETRFEFPSGSPQTIASGLTSFRSEPFPTSFRTIHSTSLSNATDFDGDGIDDLLVTSDLAAAYLIYGNGSFAINGEPRQVIGLTEGGLVVDPERNQVLGRAIRFDRGISGFDAPLNVRSAGDVNGDGFGDIFIENDFNDVSYLVYGAPRDPAIAANGHWQVEVATGQEIVDVDFGATPLAGEIRGRTFRDLNNNSVRDAGEFGIAGATIYVDENDNRSLDEGEAISVTDAEGGYSFTNLEAFGTYFVRQVPASSVEQTLPSLADDGAYEITLDAGEIFEDADFGNRDLVNGVGAGLIRGTLFDDANSNGDMDPGESGISNRAVYVDLNANSIRDAIEPTAVTDTSGEYVFAGLAANVYSVRLDTTTSESLSTPRRSQFTASPIEPGDAPQAVESADFNGDGKLDLAVANYETNKVAVFLAKNDGSFSGFPDSSVTVGSNPTSLALADLDGDGHVDIVIGHQSSSFIGVLKNTGDGAFSAVEKLSAGDGPRGVAVADFDGTGGPDIVVANQFSDSVSVFINNGGTFASPFQINVGDAPTSVSIGNLDNNNGPDIVTTNSGDQSISVILNTGGNTFFTPIAHTVGQLPFDSDLADLDNDGILDVAVVNVLSDSATVLFGLGNGGFEDSLSLRAGTGPTSVTAIDLEQDGRIDLLVTNGSALNLAVLRNLGNRNFESPDSFGVGEIETTLAWAATANDFNGDGVIDVAVANGDADSVSIMSNSLVNGSYRVRIGADETVTDVNFGIAGGDAAFEKSIVLSGAGNALSLSSLPAAQLAVLESIDIRGSGDNSIVLDATTITTHLPNQELRVIADEDDSVTVDSGWEFAGVETVGGVFFRRFTNGDAKLAVAGPYSWTNPFDPEDVSGDGTVSPLDALTVINALSSRRDYVDADENLLDPRTIDGALFSFLDTNVDGGMRPSDILQVLNRLSQDRFDAQEELVSGEGIAITPLVAASEFISDGFDRREVEDLSLADTPDSDTLPHAQVFGPLTFAAKAPAVDAVEWQPTEDADRNDELRDELDELLAGTFDWLEDQLLVG